MSNENIYRELEFLLNFKLNKEDIKNNRLTSTFENRKDITLEQKEKFKSSSVVKKKNLNLI